MSHRFVEASEEAITKTQEVRDELFPLLESATIKVLFDTRMRKRGNKIVLGRMLRANDLIRKLTDDLAEEGCDYIMFLDEVAFTNIPPADQVRLIRHELRHCKVMGTPEKPRYKVIPHDIEDFEVEISLNSDNVGWARNAAQLTSDIYEQMSETKKDETSNETTAPAKKKKK